MLTECIVTGPGLGEAVEAGGLIPGALKVGRGLIGSAAGAYGGSKVGGGIGGLFGETGRKIGEGIPLREEVFTVVEWPLDQKESQQRSRRDWQHSPVESKRCPSVCECFYPESMVPGPSEDALAATQGQAKQEMR